MIKIRLIATTALVASSMLMPVFGHAQQSLNFSVSSPKGGCIIGFKGGNAPGTEKQMKLEFLYRVSDGNFGAQINVNGWPRAQEASPDAVVPVTLVLDNGKETVSVDGGYSSGFNDRLWATWGKEKSAETFAMMKEAKSVHVKADGLDFGAFDLQTTGLVHSWITGCAEKQKAAQ